MRYCDQCGAQLNDNANFCSTCGTPVVTEQSKLSTCQNCGEIIEDGASFCANCGERCSDAHSKNVNTSAIGSSLNTTQAIGSNKKTITEYLKKVVALEKSIYTQEQVIDELSDRIEDLGISMEYRKPNQPVEYTDNIFKNVLGPAFTGGLVGGIAGAIFGATFSTGAIVGALLVGGFMLIMNIRDVSSVNNERETTYRNAMEEYNNAVRDNEIRVKKETQEKQRLIPIVLTMREQLDETIFVLNQYYATDIIFPKYRNLVAVCSFYEYFVSGRCSALTGHEGAYNIFENEVRMERICATLDEVVERLDEIKMNQYTLCTAIQEGNQITQSLVEASIQQAQLTERIAENSEITRYNTERAALCAEANAWIGIANYAELREMRK